MVNDIGVNLTCETGICQGWVRDEVDYGDVYTSTNKTSQKIIDKKK